MMIPDDGCYHCAYPLQELSPEEVWVVVTDSLPLEYASERWMCEWCARRRYPMTVEETTEDRAWSGVSVSYTLRTLLVAMPGDMLWPS